MQSKSLNELLAKYRGNEPLINIDVAFRRAIDNTSDTESYNDIKDLLFHGASPVQSRWDNKKPLDIVRLQGRHAIIPLLLEARSTHSQVNRTSWSNYNSNLCNPACNNTLISLLLFACTSKDIKILKQVSFIYAAYAAEYEVNLEKNLPSNYKQILERLHPLIKIIVSKRMAGEINIPQLSELFKLLNLTQYDVKKSLLESIFIDEKDKQYLKEQNEINHAYIVSSIFKICPLNKLRRNESEKIVYLVDKHIIEIDLLNAILDSIQTAALPIFDDKIIQLLDPKVINFHLFSAIKPDDKKLAIKMCFQIREFQPEHQILLKYLTFYEYFLLKDRTPFFEWSDVHLNYLVDLLQLMGKKLVGQLNNFHEALSPNGIAAFKEGLLTVEQANQFNSLQWILSDNGLACLRNKLFTVEDAISISTATCGDNLEYLLTEEGLEALKQGIISVNDAKQYTLVYINIPGAITALQDNLVTLSHLSGEHLNYDTFMYLFSEPGLQALRDKLFVADDINLLNEVDICSLLHPVGLTILGKKLITLQEIEKVPYDNLSLLFDVNNPDIIEALELKLISPSDFHMGQTYEEGISAKETQELIREFRNSDINDPNIRNIITVQNQCRRFYAQNQFNLFRDINQLLQLGKVNIGNLHQIDKSLSLAEKGRFEEAQAGLKLV